MSLRSHFISLTLAGIGLNVFIGVNSLAATQTTEAVSRFCPSDLIRASTTPSDRKNILAQAKTDLTRLTDTTHPVGWAHYKTYARSAVHFIAFRDDLLPEEKVEVYEDFMERMAGVSKFQGKKLTSTDGFTIFIGAGNFVAIRSSDGKVFKNKTEVKQKRFNPLNQAYLATTNSEFALGITDEDLGVVEISALMRDLEGVLGAINSQEFQNALLALSKLQNAYIETADRERIEQLALALSQIHRENESKILKGFLRIH